MAPAAILSAELDGKRIVMPAGDGDRDWSCQPIQANDWRAGKQSGSVLSVAY
jgi:hypothetical protein